MSSSLVVLCSNHEITEDTKTPQINHRLLAGLASTPQTSRERLLAYLHLIHLQQHSKIRGVVAKTGSGVRERCYHRAAGCGPHPTSIWANMHQKTEKKHGNYHPLQQKAKALREFHSPRRSRAEMRKRISETGLHMDFPLAHPVSQQISLIRQAHTRKQV